MNDVPFNFIVHRSVLSLQLIYVCARVKAVVDAKYQPLKGVACDGRTDSGRENARASIPKVPKSYAT